MRDAGYLSGEASEGAVVPDEEDWMWGNGSQQRG